MDSYRTYCYGEKGEISLILLNSPIKNGLFGMVRSPLFSCDIGIHLLQKKQEEVDLAGAYVAKNGQLMVCVSPAIYRGSVTPIFLSVLFHELGHCFYGHVYRPSESSDERRVGAVENGNVLTAELQADAFAVKYLGKKRVIDGFLGLLRVIEEEDGQEVSAKELRLRMQAIEESA